ncbi:hypothetical protein ACI797_11670 [Geodermatophilus sp. SYSU D00691]
MTRPDEAWRVVGIGDVASITAPRDAREQQVQPLDSVVGILEGDGYEILYEYGRYGGREGGGDPAARSRAVGDRTATETSPRVAAGGPWKVVRVLDVPDGDNVLTVRVSCVDERTCRLADRIFDSVRFRSA